MYFVYILTNKWKTVLYTGMTDNLQSRLLQHRDRVFDGFTKKYNCTQLVYYEELSTASAAAKRELQIKGWKRVRKIALVESMNPTWDDLSPLILR